MSIYDIVIISILLFVFCVGTVIGSFLNVVILRAFSGESIVMPPSKCPKCGNKLKWWHNIPILSYIFLRGKCGFCHEKISIQYPIVEFITGVLFVLVFIRYGLTINTIFALATASLLLVLSVTDIKEKVVFCAHTYSLILVGFLYNLILTGYQIFEQVNTISGFHITGAWCLYNPLTSSILGLIVGALIMEIAARIGYIIAGERAFGEGDTYIAAGLGAMFGWQNVLLILFLSVILQLIFTFPLFYINQIRQKHYNSVISLTLFIIYTVLFYIIQHKTGYMNNFVILLLSMAVLLALGIWACICVLRGLKNRDSLTFLPFGPALAIAGLLVLITNITLPI